MTTPSTPHRHGRRIVGGISHVFLADALMLPLGLVTAMYLTRKLGPTGYGVYSLTIVVITWLEVSLMAPFARMTIRLVAAAKRWEPIAASALRAQLALAVIAAGVVWTAAGPIARALNEPALEAFLRLFVIDMPIFAATAVHRNALVGLGRYRQRAIVSISRWTARLVLIILLVEFGFSINGALIGGIAASLAELLVSRLFIRPGIWEPGFPVRRLITTGLPLIALDATMRLVHRLDLVMLKILDGSTTEAGLYSAAQNVALIPALLAGAFSTVLLAGLSHVLHDGHLDDFRLYSRRAIRCGLVMFPFAAVTAGCSDELIPLMFGPDYHPAAAMLSPLIFAAAAMFLVYVGSSILFAEGHAYAALATITPTVPLAIIGYVLVVPTHGGIGAAWISCLAAATAASALMTVVVALARIAPPIATLLRATALSFLCYYAATLWPASSHMVLLKLATLGFAILSTLLILRECDREELQAVFRLIRRPTN